MQKTDIEWVKNPDGIQGYSWNPIKGPCPQECKLPDGRIYCYGHNLNRRFWHYEKPFFKEEEWQMAYEPTLEEKGIFVCSIFDLFHPITETHLFGSKKITWRSLILGAIEDLPQHRFYILTKFPQNIDRPMPDNVWLGVSITGNSKDDFMRASYFGFLPRKAKIQFISYELLLEMPSYNIPHVDWIIIGKLTGYGHKYDPKREWIEKIISSEEAKSTPIFLKDNLKEIWGKPLIQEMPEQC